MKRRLLIAAIVLSLAALLFSLAYLRNLYGTVFFALTIGSGFMAVAIPARSDYGDLLRSVSITTGILCLVFAVPCVVLLAGIEPHIASPSGLPDADFIPLVGIHLFRIAFTVVLALHCFSSCYRDSMAYSIGSFITLLFAGVSLVRTVQKYGNEGLIFWAFPVLGFVLAEAMLLVAAVTSLICALIARRPFWD